MNKGNLDMPDQQKQLGPQDHQVERVKQQITQYARDEIPGLYAKFLKDQQSDPEIVKLCIDHCREDHIPGLFGKFSEDVRKFSAGREEGQDIVSLAIQKCRCDQIVELFCLFTEDVKKDNSIVSLAIKQCRCDQIAALYDKLPKDQGRDLEIARLFVENCDGYPDDQYIPELFCKFKEDVKKDSNLVHLAFEKCSRTMIPALFGELTDDMMKDNNIAKLAIQKCSGPHIPELFGKFTEDVKQIPVKPKGASPRRPSASDMFEIVQKRDDNIVNLAFQKCPDFTIPGLYAKLPEDQKEDLEILKLCEKCSAYTIADLFDAFPENLKRKEDTVKSYFDKSDGVNIQKIFAALPKEQRSDQGIIDKYFNKCSDRSIPALFGEFTEVVKRHEGNMDRAFEKCADDEIPGLYANFLEDKKNDLEIVKRCINLCRKDKIPELFGKFTEDVKKKHQDIMTLALNKCDGTAIPDLFRLFTEDVKKKQHNNFVTLDNDIVSLAIQNCRKPNIPDLFGLIPENFKSDVAIMMKFIDKWDPRSIPALFGEFAERVKKDTNIVSSAIRKCDDENIPDLLYAIPTSVVVKDNIKDMCIDKCQHLIEKCDEREIQALFGKFRNDVKEDKSIVEKALQKCADDKIPELFGEFTEGRKGDVENVVNLAMNKCFENKIPELYDKFLLRHKTDTEIAKQCIGKCRSNFIPDLFRLIPENAKSNVNILKELINKWDSRNIPALFGTFTVDVKKNKEIVNLIFKKCADTEIPGLVAQFSDKSKEEFWCNIANQLPGNRIPIIFEALLQVIVPSQDLWNAYFKECEKSHTQQLFATLPDHLKNDEEFWKESVELCDKIPQLFAVLPDNVKSQEICNTCLMNQNLRDKEIPEFFANLPENMKKHEEIQNQCVKRCPEKEIPRFFATIPEDLKMDFWDQCLEKCNTEDIMELFHALPDDIKGVKEEVINVINDCPVLRIPRLFDALSEDIKQDEDVKEALEKASLTNAPFFEKYSFLFETLVRIAGASLVFLGPEFMTIFFQDHLKEFAEKHWIREDYEGSESWSFYPIEGCRLQPPQPFDVQLPFNVGKMFCLTAALSFPPRNLQWAGQTPTTGFERIVFYAVAAYSTVVVPLAMISVVHHFFSEVYSGIEGGWNAYECFYASWNFGPYNFNYQLLLIRYFGSRVVLQSTAKTSDEEEAFKLSSIDVPSLRECLLEEEAFKLSRRDVPSLRECPVTDKREIERRKMRVSTLMPLIITVVPFAVVDIPFIFTHKLPAVFFFAGFVLAWLILVCIMTWITYPKLFTRPTSTLSAHFSQLLEESGRTGYLSALPLLFGLSVTSDFLTLAPIYLYNGEGAIYSAVTFFTERSSHKYIYSLSCRVVRKVYSLSAVLSEIM